MKTTDKEAAYGLVALLVVAAAGIGWGFALGARHHQDPPAFVDLGRVATETVAGRSASAEYQRGVAERQRQVAALDAEAKKLPDGSRERAAKEAEAQRAAAALPQQNQAAAKVADDAFQKAVAEVAARLRPGETIAPARPLVGGVDLTDQVIGALAAANEDAAGKLRASQAEVEQLRKRLAEAERARPLPAASAPK